MKRKKVMASVLCAGMVLSLAGGVDCYRWNIQMPVAMAEQVSDANVIYGGDVVTNKDITLAIGEMITVKTDLSGNVEWKALDATVVNVLTASGHLTGRSVGNTVVTVRAEDGTAASIRIHVVNPENYEGFQYVENTDGTVKIISYTGTGERDVVVPAKINGKPVTHISYGVFGATTGIDSITFEEGIRVIDDYAMARTSLKCVEFPASLSYISDNCFSQGSVNQFYCVKGSVAEQYLIEKGKEYETKSLPEGANYGKPIREADTTLDVIEPVPEESAVTVLTDKNFESEVHKTAGKLVIDVSTTWCQPCQKMKPYYEQLGKKYKGDIRFASLDGDDYGKLVKDCNISAYPTLLFYADGKLIGKFVGSLDYDALEEKIVSTFAGITSTAEPGQSVTPVPTSQVAETPAPTATPKPQVTPGQSSNKLTKTKVLKVVRTKKGKIKVILQKVSKVDGYKILISENKTFSKKRILFSKNATVTIQKLKSGKKYYIKAYTYRKDGNKKRYSVGSNIKAVKVK